MNRRETIRADARELAAYIAKHPSQSGSPFRTTPSSADIRYRILALTGGGDGYTDHELDFLERAVRWLNRPR